MMKRYCEYRESGIPWIGNIPKHWETRRAKYMFVKNKRQRNPEDEVITCFRDGQVTLRKNRRTTGFTESEKYDGYQGIRKGDLVIHQMDAFAGAVGVSDSDGMGTSVYHCCTPLGDYNVYYYAHLIRHMAFTGFIQSLYKGVRERSSDFSFPIFGNQFLVIPPRCEQDAIVEYINAKVEKIDSYISERERELQLLAELKQAEIVKVVTQGLSSGMLKKDSGIPWVGMIPEHWDIKILSQVAYEHYMSNKDVHHQNLLSLSYGNIIRKDINTTEGLLPASFDDYQIVEEGNIIMRLTDLQNDHKSLRVGLVKEEGIITSAYVCLGVTNPDMIVPAYLYNLLHTYDILKLFYSMGGGIRQGLNWQGLKRLGIIIPPVEEQLAIIANIERKDCLYKSMKASIETEIARLKEYKQRMIADAVTGAICVQ